MSTCCLPHDIVYGKQEQHWWQNAPLPNTCHNIEKLRCSCVGSHTTPWVMIDVLEYILTNHCGMPYTRQICQSELRWTLSNAFSKSMKLTTRGCWNSTHCSMMLRRVKISSAQDQPCQNPACSSPNSTSTASWSLTSRTVQKAFPGSSVIITLLIKHKWKMSH